MAPRQPLGILRLCITTRVLYGACCIIIAPVLAVQTRPNVTCHKRQSLVLVDNIERMYANGEIVHVDEHQHDTVASLLGLQPVDYVDHAHTAAHRRVHPPDT